VQKVAVNGAEQHGPFLAHSVIAAGGTLDFTLAPEPAGA
jgi:putative alpha-1,2-mannosidase